MNQLEAVEHFQRIIMKHDDKPSQASGLTTEKLITELFKRVDNEAAIEYHNLELLRLSRLIEIQAQDKAERELMDRVETEKKLHLIRPEDC